MNGSIAVITPAAVFPVTLAEAKAHLRVDTSDDDTLIGGMIAAATGYAERFMGRTLVDTTYDLVLDKFPTGRRPLIIPRPPVIEVEDIFVTDSAGDEAAYGGSYSRDLVGGRLLAPASGWPTGTTEASIRVRYRAGYVRIVDESPLTTAGDVPDDIKAAILLYLGSLYLQRESLAPGAMSIVPWSAEQILRQHRVEMSLA
jgi:uncharacterized phiE125 gp8 family phage protein